MRSLVSVSSGASLPHVSNTVVRQKLSVLPHELMIKIFLYLASAGDVQALADLNACRQMNRAWRDAAEDKQVVKIIRNVLGKICFGPTEWAKYFGDVGKAPSLPHNIIEILNQPCPIHRGRKIGETHTAVLIPKTVDGNPLTIKSIQSLTTSPKEGNSACYRFLWAPIARRFGDVPAEESRWLLITNEILPGSRGMSDEEHQEMIIDLIQTAQTNYEVPRLLDAIVSAFVKYVGQPNRAGILPWDPQTYTRCQEEINEQSTIVGGFTLGGGLGVGTSFDADFLGTVAVRKLWTEVWL